MAPQTTITPLCAEFERLHATTPRTPKRQTKRIYDSPERYASTLKPILPTVPQNVFRLARHRPAKYADRAYFRCSRFKYQPTHRNTRRVRFDDSALTATELYNQRLHHLIDHPTFLAKYAACQLKNVAIRRQRRPRHSLKCHPHHQSTTPIDNRRSGCYEAPLPTSPFNSETENDAFEFFPELQHPFSALRNDTATYHQQLVDAEEAAAMRPYERGSPLDRKAMIQQALRLGPFEVLRTPTRPRRHPRPTLLAPPPSPTPKPIDSALGLDYSPMQLD